MADCGRGVGSSWPWAVLRFLIVAAPFIGLAMFAVGAGRAQAADFACHSVLFGCVPADALAMSFTADGGGVVVLDRNFTLTTWRLGEDGPDAAVPLDMNEPVSGAATLLPAFGMVVMVDRAGAIVTWSIDDGTILDRRDSAEPILCSAVDPASGRIATSHASGVLRIWDLGESSGPSQLAEGYAAVTSLVFLPAAGALGVASGTRGVLVIDSFTGRPLQTLERYVEPVKTDPAWPTSGGGGCGKVRNFARLRAVPDGSWLAVVVPGLEATTWQWMGGRYRKRREIERTFGDAWWDARGRLLSGFLSDDDFTVYPVEGGEVWRVKQEPAAIPAVTAVEAGCAWQVYVTRDRHLCAWRWVQAVPVVEDSGEAAPATLAVVRPLREEALSIPSMESADSLAVLGFQIGVGGATRVHTDWPAGASGVPGNEDDLSAREYLLLDTNHDGHVSPGERQRLRVVFASTQPSWLSRRLGQINSIGSEISRRRHGGTPLPTGIPYRGGG